MVTLLLQTERALGFGEVEYSLCILILRIYVIRLIGAGAPACRITIRLVTQVCGVHDNEATLTQRATSLTAGLRCGRERPHIQINVPIASIAATSTFSITENFYYKAATAATSQSRTITTIHYILQLITETKSMSLRYDSLQQTNSDTLFWKLSVWVYSWHSGDLCIELDKWPQLF